MRMDSGLEVSELRVDGAASANNLLMQMQADIANLRVVRTRTPETTALGAAYLAALATGFWTEETIDHQWTPGRVFTPQSDQTDLRERWARAVAGRG